MAHRAIFFWVIITSLASLAAPARAIDDSTRAAARAMVNEGARLYSEGRFEEALSEFTRAIAVAEVPTVAVWIARAQERRGRLISATEAYQRALLMQPNDLWVGGVQQDAQRRAKESLRLLQPRIPSLRLIVMGHPATELRVLIDGVLVPAIMFGINLPMDPGPHEIVTSRGGHSVIERVTLAEGEARSVTLDFPRAALLPTSSMRNAIRAPAVQQTVAPKTGITRASPSTSGSVTNTTANSLGPWHQRTIGWAVTGVGLAGLTLGATAGVISGIKRADLRGDGCEGDNCPGKSYQSRVDSYNSWRAISTIGFVVGAAGTVVGIALLLPSSRRRVVSSASLILSPDAMSVKVAF